MIGSPFRSKQGPNENVHGVAVYEPNRSLSEDTPDNSNVGRIVSLSQEETSSKRQLNFDDVDGDSSGSPQSSDSPVVKPPKRTRKKHVRLVSSDEESRENLSDSQLNRIRPPKRRCSRRNVSSSSSEDEEQKDVVKCNPEGVPIPPQRLKLRRISRTTDYKESHVDDDDDIIESSVTESDYEVEKDDDDDDEDDDDDDDDDDNEEENCEQDHEHSSPTSSSQDSMDDFIVDYTDDDNNNESLDDESSETEGDASQDDVSWGKILLEENDSFFIYPEQVTKQGFAYYAKMRLRRSADVKYRDRQLRRIQAGEPPVQQGDPVIKLNHYEHIEKMIATTIDRLVSKAWVPRFKNALEMYPRINVCSAKRRDKRCEGCNRSNSFASKRMFLSGTSYEQLTLEPIVCEDAGSQDFELGTTCAKRSSAYHAAFHFKFNLDEACKDKFRGMKQHCPDAGTDRILQECMVDKDYEWLNTLYTKFTKMVDGVVLVERRSDPEDDSIAL